jgi:hypothetical protein
MKPFVTSAIIGASFDNSGPRSVADAKSQKRAEQYIERNSNCVSHIIYRSYGETPDNKKHLYCLAGVPLLVYVIRNAVHSGLEEIIVVGDEEIKTVVEAHNEVFGKTKNVEWTSEGGKKELSFSNTLAKGARSGKQMFIPGDVPMFCDINNVIYDEDAAHYDIVADLNTYENTCIPVEGFLRNWYFKIKNYYGETMHAKEPNCVVADFKKQQKMFNILYSTRKAGELMKSLLQETISEDEKFYRMFPYILRETPYFLAALLKKIGLNVGDPGINYSSILGLANPFMGAKVLVKMEHKSIGRVMDMDSHEDIEHLEHVLAEQGLAQAYPYCQDIEHFRTEGIPLLAKQMKMYEDFSAFVNDRRKTVGMPVLYDAEGRLIKSRDMDYLERIEKCRKILENDKNRVLCKNC